MKIENKVRNQKLELKTAPVAELWIDRTKGSIVSGTRDERATLSMNHYPREIECSRAMSDPLHIDEGDLYSRIRSRKRQAVACTERALARQSWRVIGHSRAPRHLAQQVLIDYVSRESAKKPLTRLLNFRDRDSALSTKRRWGVVESLFASMPYYPFFELCRRQLQPFRFSYHCTWSSRGSLRDVHDFDTMAGATVAQAGSCRYNFNGWVLAEYWQPVLAIYYLGIVMAQYWDDNTNPVLASWWQAILARYWLPVWNPYWKKSTGKADVGPVPGAIRKPVLGWRHHPSTGPILGQYRIPAVYFFISTSTGSVRAQYWCKSSSDRCTWA